MSSVDVWAILLALLALVMPLGLAWLLLAWRDRKRGPSAGSAEQRRR